MVAINAECIPIGALLQISILGYRTRSSMDIRLRNDGSEAVESFVFCEPLTAYYNSSACEVRGWSGSVNPAQEVATRAVRWTSCLWTQHPKHSLNFSLSPGGHQGWRRKLATVV